MESRFRGLSHLFMTVFLYTFGTFMVVPAITDVTMEALCPGRDECSIAIYLTGLQQALVGLGTILMTPLIGNLSDKYGRKALLTIPMTLGILPLVVLAYSRERNFFYVYYGLRVATGMICEGSVTCLALAYVADNVPDHRRATAFGILSGIGSAAFVCGTLSVRFLSTSATFQVSAGAAMFAVVYMRAMLPESITDEDECLITPSSKVGGEAKVVAEVDDEESEKMEKNLFKSLPSFAVIMSLLKTSTTFSQAVVVGFFSNLGEVGLHASLMYYLKARFQFNKDEFADLMIIAGIAGTVSQLLIMPVLTTAVGEVKLLSLGLFINCVHIVLYGIAWASWVPYVCAMLSVLMVFSQPCLRSIVSKQVGPSEQGKAQGCISGICSLANVVSPLIFSPLTALFLSDKAPFHFPGFSIICTGFAIMIALTQSLMIRAPAPASNHIV
uniref:Major facilitator superfamily (MFS) profile domain-containing protein n=1 Tax=Kalanchoe fedtschenkoi TaxID=63787 RepID=A0A7N0R9S4_KALFE